MTDPVMSEFVARLVEINAVADASPGFVWRLQTEDGDATALRPYADTRILINLSVWTDLAALRARPAGIPCPVRTSPGAMRAPPPERSTSRMYRVRQQDLPFQGSSHHFVGADNGDVN